MSCLKACSSRVLVCFHSTHMCKYLQMNVLQKHTSALLLQAFKEDVGPEQFNYLLNCEILEILIVT